MVFSELPTVHLDGDLRAHHGAEGAPFAGFPEELRRVIPLLIEGLGNADRLVRAYGDTEFTALAEALIDGYLSLCCHNPIITLLLGFDDM
jgi:hypothetical protein